MKQQFVAFVLAGIGIVLLLVGAFWDRLHPPSSYWSQNKAEQYVKAFWDLHAEQDHAPHRQADDPDKSLNAARQRYESLARELDQARAARELTGKGLTVAGLIVLLSAALLRSFMGRQA